MARASRLGAIKVRSAHPTGLLRKVFGGAVILPVRVHRLKTCATKVLGCALRTILRDCGGRRDLLAATRSVRRFGIAPLSQKK